ALRHAWFPVARSVDLDIPQPATLLGENLVVYRTPEGRAVVQSRRCPHRGGDLSQGRVMQDGITCPYHGWRFRAADGACAVVPSLPNDQQHKIPERAVVRTYPVVERFEHVWTVLEEPAHSMYDPADFQDMDLETAAAAAIPAPIGVAAAMENFRDVAHFAFVHTVSMGQLPEVIEPLKVRREGLNINMDRFFKAGEGDWSVNGDCTMQYRCTAPGFASVIFDHGILGKRVLGIFPSPHTYDSVTLFCVVGVERGWSGTPLADCIEFEEMVTHEDVGVVGRIDPPEVPWDNEVTEVSVPADAYTLNYRAAFWQFVRETQEESTANAGAAPKRKIVSGSTMSQMPPE
ncbi:Rieske 2Fe-2S domain-containing protein, partial [Streptomyces sp900105245]